MAHPFAQLQLRLPWVAKPPARKAPPSQPIDAEMTAWCREAAQFLALPKLAGEVAVVWNPRMRTTAGRAFWPACRIEMNPKLRDFSEDETQRTLKHELAHLVAYARSGRRRIAPHGLEWQTACTDLGIPGENVRHTLPFKPRRMVRKYSYTCPSCTAVFTRVRPIKRTSACHSCCRKHNGGRFHPRFRLIQARLSEK
ncbi:MAG: SprT family zinc-dependent metalloprotease [Luteolibacter sp.]